jgi:hypothetical protein
MVHENMVEKCGRSTPPQDLMNSTAAHKYLAVEFSISKTRILVGSRLPRGGWEAWIDKIMHLGSVVELARGGRGT